MTSVALSQDESFICSGSKDNSVIYWDIETQKKTTLKQHWTRKNSPTTQSSSGEVLAVAISHDGKYIVSGGRDNIIRIYDKRLPIETNQIKTFQGHRDTITSLSFRYDTYTLFSGSLDRTLKHWDLTEMAYIETMFGHQEGVLAIDCYKKNKPISVSSDRTTRLWSIEGESHLVYRYKPSSVECIRYIADDKFITGAQNGMISLWKATQKKPLYSVYNAHGIEGISPRWVTSVSSMRMSDLVLSGSYDGFVRFWQLGSADSVAPLTHAGGGAGGKAAHTTHTTTNSTGSTHTHTSNSHIPKLGLKFEYPIEGFVNDMVNTNRLIVIGVGKEHKYGRWWNIKQACNDVVLLKLQSS